MLTMTPLPSPTRSCWPASSPKKKRNQGSLLLGFRLAALLVLMLTTAGDAFFAAVLKLPGAMTAFDDAGACVTEITRSGEEERPRIHVGLSVETTKYPASRTVTAWAKSSQVRFMRMAVIRQHDTKKSGRGMSAESPYRRRCES